MPEVNEFPPDTSDTRVNSASNETEQESSGAAAPDTGQEEKHSRPVFSPAATNAGKTGRPRKKAYGKTAEFVSPEPSRDRQSAAAKPKTYVFSTANEPREAEWEAEGPEKRKRFLEQVYVDYFAIVDDYLTYANMSVQKYTRLSEFHGRWRKWTIIATGGLAGLNALAAFELVGKIDVTGSVRLASFISAAAAIYAVGLTIAGNLENLFNAGEKAAGFRESRELFVSRYREYLFKWLQYVEAFGFSSKACVNAGGIYRELIESDKELRSKIKDLTEVKPRTAGDTDKK